MVFRKEALDLWGNRSEEWGRGREGATTWPPKAAEKINIERGSNDILIRGQDLIIHSGTTFWETGD